MAQNPFVLPVEQYTREINPVRDWMHQTALYASRTLNKPFDQCLAHLQAKIKNKQIPITNPTVVYFERGENGDREKTTGTLSRYLQDTLRNNEILAPTFTTYLHPSIKQSVIVDLLDENVGERKRYKKESQAYKAKNDLVNADYYNQLQDSCKRANNSVSGGFVAEGSVVNNKSAHSTLTSSIRSIASLSNASNERLVEGNRHYYSPKIALYNVISTVSACNHQAIDTAVQQFGLVYPSVEQTMACILRSLKLYCLDMKAVGKIETFVGHLTPTERAAVVYTGDLYHLRVLNDQAIRTMITALSRRGSTVPCDDPIKDIYATDEQVVNYAHQVNIGMMRGKGKDYGKLTQEECYILRNTCRNIEAVVETYRPLLLAFFLTKNSPCTIATIASMERRAVVLSDTDSTMFAVDNWVEWYFGKLEFSDEGIAVAGSIMYLATQAIIHILALFSANMNVERRRLFTLAMKPEYFFPVFAQTSVAKHYYTAMLVKEGNVYNDIEVDRKGVHMKNSTIPSNIIDGAAREMEAIIRTVMAGEKIDIKGLIERTIAIEHDILRSLYAGESTYLKRASIKEASAYKKEGGESPFQYYTLWEVAFADVYGHAPHPPYGALTIPLDLPNKTAVKEWFQAMEAMGPDSAAISLAIQRWYAANGKTVVQSFPVPSELCKSTGVPKELKLVMNTRKIVLALTKSYRNILESLGYFPKENYLISELNGVPLPT